MVFEKIKEAYLRKYEARPLPTLYLTIMLAALAVVFIISLCWNQFFLFALGKMEQHLFMDHFWSAVDSMYYPYTVMHVIYPPLITCVYGMIGRYSLPFVDHSTGDLYIDMYNSQVPMMIFILLLAFGLLLVAWLVEHKTDKHLTRIEKKLVIGTVILSYPFLIGIENGNSIFYAVVFVFLFLLGYDSQNKWIRVLSYISLGIASGMKVTPCLFGLLILRNKNVKEFFLCVAIVAAIALIPFVFTDGSITILYENMAMQSLDLGGSCTNIRKIFHELTKLTGVTVFDTVGLVITILITVSTCFIAAFDRKMKMWEMVTLLTCLMVIGFGVGTPYLMCYLVIAMCFFFASEKEPTKRNIFFCVTLAIVLSMSPDLLALKVLGLIAMFSYLTCVSYGHLREYLNERKIRKSEMSAGQ